MYRLMSALLDSSFSDKGTVEETTNDFLSEFALLAGDVN
jgi:hypothetical protein